MLNKIRFFFASIFFIAFLVCCAYSINNLHSSYKDKRNSFELFTFFLLENVQKAFLISKVLESEYSAPTNVFLKHNAKLSVIGDVVNDYKGSDFLYVLSYLNAEMPHFFSGNYSLYYRDHMHDFIIANDSKNEMYFDKDWFNNRCKRVSNCSKYASSFDLSDHIHISTLYEDIITGGYVFTISSPVYYFNERDKQLVGDVSIDIYLDKILFLYNKEIEFKKNNSNLVSVMIRPKGDFFFENIGFTFNHSLDNVHDIRMTYPIEGFLFFHLGLLLLVSFVILVLYISVVKISNKSNNVTQLVKKSYTDPMTGVFNRHIFIDSDFVSKISNGGGLISIDGNKIKLINDTHGHKVGDLAIKTIATSISDNVRVGDYVIRLGGDEFLVVLPGSSREVTVEIENRIKDSFKSNSDFGCFNISVSTGVSMFKNLSDLELAIENADFFMYKDKDKDKESSD